MEFNESATHYEIMIRGQFLLRTGLTGTEKRLGLSYLQIISHDPASKYFLDINREIIDAATDHEDLYDGDRRGKIIREAAERIAAYEGANAGTILYAMQNPYVQQNREFFVHLADTALQREEGIPGERLRVKTLVNTVVPDFFDTEKLLMECYENRDNLYALQFIHRYFFPHEHPEHYHILDEKIFEGTLMRCFSSEDDFKAMLECTKHCRPEVREKIFQTLREKMFTAEVLKEMHSDIEKVSLAYLNTILEDGE